jgi:hypothetical protein
MTAWPRCVADVTPLPAGGTFVVSSHADRPSGPVVVPLPGLAFVAGRLEDKARSVGIRGR